MMASAYGQRESQLIARESLTLWSSHVGLSCAGIAAFNLVFGLAFGRWASLTEARELLRLSDAEAARGKRD